MVTNLAFLVCWCAAAVATPIIWVAPHQIGLKATCHSISFSQLKTLRLHSCLTELAFYGLIVVWADDAFSVSSEGHRRGAQPTVRSRQQQSTASGGQSPWCCTGEEAVILDLELLGLEDLELAREIANKSCGDSIFALSAHRGKPMAGVIC
jgi:hypothetical protein